MKKPLTVEVDSEVFAHLLLLQVKRGGSLSDQIEYLLAKADDQFILPLEGRSMGRSARPTSSPTPWTLHEMRTCFTIRDANGWGVCQLSFGYDRSKKELRRPDAERIVEAVNAQH